MLKEYSQFLNLEEVIKDKYNYQYDSERVDDFYEQDFVELEGNGVTAMCWIKIDNEKYLFKPIPEFEFNVWGELLSKKIADKLKIPCAEYRACTLGDKKGLLTKNIIKDEEETLLLGCEFFQNFFNEYPKEKTKIVSILEDDRFMSAYDVPKEFLDYNHYDRQRYLFNHLNNLEQVWSMLSDYKNISQDEAFEITNSLNKMLLFDIITLQADRHVNNWGIIEDKDGYRPCPLFDNAVSFGLGNTHMNDKVNEFRNDAMNYRYTKDDSKIKKQIDALAPRFTLSDDNNIDDIHKIKDDPKEVFDCYMKKSDQRGKDLAFSYLDEINSEEIDKMIEEVEEENGIKMDDNLRFYIGSMMDFHLGYLSEITNKYDRSEVVNARSSR